MLAAQVTADVSLLRAVIDADARRCGFLKEVRIEYGLCMLERGLNPCTLTRRRWRKRIYSSLRLLLCPKIYKHKYQVCSPVLMPRWRG